MSWWAKSRDGLETVWPNVLWKQQSRATWKFYCTSFPWGPIAHVDDGYGLWNVCLSHLTNELLLSLDETFIILFWESPLCVLYSHLSFFESNLFSFLLYSSSCEIRQFLSDGADPQVISYFPITGTHPQNSQLSYHVSRCFSA